ALVELGELVDGNRAEERRGRVFAEETSERVLGRGNIGEDTASMHFDDLEERGEQTALDDRPRIGDESRRHRAANELGDAPHLVEVDGRERARSVNGTRVDGRARS